MTFLRPYFIAFANGQNDDGLARMLHNFFGTWGRVNVSGSTRQDMIHAYVRDSELHDMLDVVFCNLPTVKVTEMNDVIKASLWNLVWRRVEAKGMEGLKAMLSVVYDHVDEASIPCTVEVQLYMLYVYADATKMCGFKNMLAEMMQARKSNGV